MDFKRSKTRSYGEASQSSRHSVSSPSPKSGSRPLFKDRVKSAPPATQSSRHQNARPQKTKTDLLSSELEAPEWPSIHQPSSIPILEETNSDQQIVPNFDQVIPYFIQSTLQNRTRWLSWLMKCYRLRSNQRSQRLLSQ